MSVIGSDRIGLDLIGSDWFQFGSDRMGSDRFQFGLDRIGSDRFLVRFGSVRFGSVRFGSVRFGSGQEALKFHGLGRGWAGSP